MYQKRRDVLCDGLVAAGWKVDKPKATMFVWAKIPDSFAELGSMEFSKILLTEAKVAVSPGIGFGDYGDQYVRFSLIENEQRIRQATRNIKSMLLHPERISKLIMNILRVGVLGLGTVGTGMVNVLQRNAHELYRRWWCAN